MARESVEDRIHRYLLDRAEPVAPSELVRVFLNSPAVPDALAEKVLTPLLGKDPRFARDEAGRWRAESPAARAPVAAYTVVELLFAPGVAGPLPLEVGVVRLVGDRLEEPRSTLVRPQGRLVPGVRLPEGIERASLARAPDIERVVRRLAAFARGSTLASHRRSPFHLRVCASEPASPLAYVSIARLASRVGLVPARAPFEACAAALEVTMPSEARAGERAAASAEMLRRLLSRIEEARGPRVSVEDILSPQPVEVDFSRYDFDARFLDALPSQPGIYLFRDANGRPVYVGKAKNLRARVASYFQRSVRVAPRVQAVRERAVSLEVEPVGSELEALLLEHRTIAELQPELNRQTDVHPRPAPPLDADQILILPSRDCGCAELFLLRKGAAPRQVRVPRADPETARSAIEAAYYRASAEPSCDALEELAIVQSWIAENRDAVNAVSVDQARDLDDLMRILTDHLQDDTPGERTYRV